MSSREKLEIEKGIQSEPQLDNTMSSFVAEREQGCDGCDKEHSNNSTPKFGPDSPINIPVTAPLFLLEPPPLTLLAGSLPEIVFDADKICTPLPLIAAMNSTETGAPDVPNRGITTIMASQAPMVRLPKPIIWGNEPACPSTPKCQQFLSGELQQPEHWVLRPVGIPANLEAASTIPSTLDPSQSMASTVFCSEDIMLHPPAGSQAPCIMPVSSGSAQVSSSIKFPHPSQGEAPMTKGKNVEENRVQKSPHGPISFCATYVYKVGMTGDEDANGTCSDREETLSSGKIKAQEQRDREIVLRSDQREAPLYEQWDIEEASRLMEAQEQSDREVALRLKQLEVQEESGREEGLRLEQLKAREQSERKVALRLKQLEVQEERGREEALRVEQLKAQEQSDKKVALRLVVTEALEERTEITPRENIDWNR